MAMHRISAALALAVALVAIPQARADEFQRTFVFHNTSAAPIYPVIESPQNVDKGLSVNCGSVPANNGTNINGLLRIMVNKDASTRGIPVGESLTVEIPKSAPNCPDGAFYNASRIYMLYVDPEKLEPMFNPNQRTRKYDAWNLPAPCAGCWVGIASNGEPSLPGAGYPYDVPGQLLEYTIISQNVTGAAYPNANDPRGRSLIDFDVSYVDYAHQPYAMALGDGGATQFMGSTFGVPGSLNIADFPTRISTFMTTSNWSGFDAYSNLHWGVTPSDPTGCDPPFAADGGPRDQRKTRFSCFIPFTEVAPSAAILISDANTGGGSQFFTAETWGGYSDLCHAGDGINNQCSLLPAERVYCCPDKVNGMQGCCDIKNFQVAKTLSRWFANPNNPTDPAAGTFTYSNPTLDDLVSRFKKWRDRTEDLCAASGAGTQGAPVVNRTEFCQAFKATVDYVWNVFGPQCGGKGVAHDRCVVTKIIGYDNNSGYDPSKCTYCTANPDTCPKSCVDEQISNESVQALQRSLPWRPYGPPDQCSGCPSGTPCAVACVFPKENSPLATPYQFDKWLHFWAAYDSVYNLNPYATFIHSDAGVAAPGAYSFSIDDFYGNFGGFASSLIIQAGGYSKMPNREPFDPYKQYAAGFGPGWDHVKVCGRTYQLPAGTPKHNISAPVSFWNNGVPSPTHECEVFAYPGPDESIYVKFLLTEVTYSVTDAFTGHTHDVQGLGGVAAPRGGVTPQDPYCMDPKNSTAPENIRNIACSANLAQGFQNKDYVGVSNAKCTSERDWTCGKPMISLNVPPPGLSAVSKTPRLAAQR